MYAFPSPELVFFFSLKTFVAHHNTALKLFNNVLLLYEGRQIYFGPTSEARAYFEELGFECKVPRQSYLLFLTVKNLQVPNNRRHQIFSPQ